MVVRRKPVSLFISCNSVRSVPFCGLNWRNVPFKQRQPRLDDESRQSDFETMKVGREWMRALEMQGIVGDLVCAHGHGLFPIRGFTGSAFVTEACCERMRASVEAGTLAIHHHTSQTAERSHRWNNVSNKMCRTLDCRAFNSVFEWLY